ncbi:MAG: hypothetical protein JWM08_2385, partial [Candidatus Angelobacter sp.]|nr:hypothetical protein [Candidatus Angelobacter sp.]
TQRDLLLDVHTFQAPYGLSVGVMRILTLVGKQSC